jgi:hypothetical protein
MPNHEHGIIVIPDGGDGSSGIFTGSRDSGPRKSRRKAIDGLVAFPEAIAAEAVAHALERNDEAGALSRYEQLWQGEFSTRVYFPGYAFQHMMNNRWFVDAFMRYTARKQHRTNLLADVVAHNRKRRNLFKLLNPFY